MHKNCVYAAHQALKHGLKALTLAQGRDYPWVHDLAGLAQACGVALGSDLQLLDEYAGGPVTVPLHFHLLISRKWRTTLRMI